MKKVLISLAITLVFVAGTTLTGCQSPEQKEAAARDKLQNAEEELRDAQIEANAEAQKVATAEEWASFKKDAELTIRNNEIRIAELKIKINKPGTTLDPLYEKRIETLEQQNRDLNTKISAYEKNQSDWESFKREFNHDMAALGEALRGFTVGTE